MSEPTHNPAPVDLPDVDLTAIIPCAPCGQPAVWRARIKCEQPHAWIFYCDPCGLVKAKEYERGGRRWKCTKHNVRLPEGVVEWRPL